MRQLKMSVAVILAVGFLGSGSLAWAGERAMGKQVEDRVAARQAQEATWTAELEENTEAWDSFWAAYAVAREADAEYAAAESAIDAFVASGVLLTDKKSDIEYDRLDAVLRDRDREILMSIYEDSFGQWTGDSDEFDDFMAFAGGDNSKNIRACINGAIVACGKKGVYSVTVGADGSCTFTCNLQ